MTFTQRIPADRLSDLNVHEGDTLHVQISRADASPPVTGKASEWLRSAKGSVRLAVGESVDDLRMDYYAAKHGVNR